MRRPLGYDEYLSLEYYTAAGLMPSGESRPLRRVGDLRSLPAPTWKQVAMGLYRSLGVWKEPNNHVPHSVLLNCVLLAGYPSEAVIRLPAFAAGAAFCVATLLLVNTLGWRDAAPFTLIWTAFLPYVVSFSAEARGYTLMLLLQAAFLAVAHALARNPRSIVLGAALAFLAVVTLVNVISMSVDWLVPAYASLWLVPPAKQPPNGDGYWLISWRRNLLVQLLAFGGCGFIFLVDRLAYVVSSATQYGVPFTDWRGFISELGTVVALLLPSPVWMSFGVCGILGLIAMAFSREARWLAAISGVTIAVSLGHFWLAARLPYARTCGYVLPLVVLGAAYLYQTVYAMLPRGGRPILVFGTVLYTCLFAWEPATRGESEFIDYAGQFRAVAERMNADRSELVYVLTPPEDYALAKTLPERWLTANDGVSSGSAKARLILFSTCDDPVSLVVQKGRGEELLRSGLPGSVIGVVGRYHLMECRVNTTTFVPGKSFPTAGLVAAVWYPDPMRLGVSGEAVMDLLDQHQTPFLRRNRRFPAKLDFYSQLHAIELVASSPAEWGMVQRALDAGLERFGGRVVVLVPL